MRIAASIAFHDVGLLLSFDLGVVKRVCFYRRTLWRNGGSAFALSSDPPSVPKPLLVDIVRLESNKKVVLGLKIIMASLSLGMTMASIR